MPPVEILPEPTQAGGTRYRARWGNRQAAADTPGQALDAIWESEGQEQRDASTTVILFHHLGADRFFSAEQQERLGDLMEEFHHALDSGATLSEEEEAELEQLVQSELEASANRAAALAEASGR